MKRVRIYLLACLTVLSVLSSCSVYKHVPQGDYLLRKVEIISESDSLENPSSFRAFVNQTPNSRWFGLIRLPLRVYSLSGVRNPERLYNRALRNLGEEPVVLDQYYTSASARNMQLQLVNSGYLKANVSSEVKYGRRPKAKVSYHLKPGDLYRVENIEIEIQDSAIALILKDNSHQSLIHTGMNLDAQLLDQERTRIANLLMRYGYYGFSKDYISFVADTLSGSSMVGLKMILASDGMNENGSPRQHTQYTLSGIDYVFVDNPTYSKDALEDYRTLFYKGFRIHHPESETEPLIRPDVLDGHSFLRVGQEYSSDSIAKTYNSLSRLGILKYTNIRFEPELGTDDRLKANVYMVAHPKHSFNFELDGTNTAGDLGASASVSLINRNLFRGSEQLSLKLRGAYESITNLPGVEGDTYTELGAEVNLTFPEFLMPFMTADQQRKTQATSQLSAKVNQQRRPEFMKTVFSAGWSYLWSDSWKKSHRLDVLDLNYLVVPWISDYFQKEYLDNISSKRSILKFNYENLLISKLGYTFYYTNSKLNSTNPFQYTVRAGFETSGNVFYGLSELMNAQRNGSGQYEILNIAFSQYMKHDFSMTANWRMESQSNVLLHVEWGVAVPYLNSTSIPFEKRYFAGGANSVRGWSVRELGPGTYSGNDKTIDYIKQSGDIKLGASIEFRSKLFWKFNGAMFVDAGNIWTIREYPEQPGGCFRFDSFYKEIAMSYGLGLRMDLGILVLRLDGGLKAFNPAGTSFVERVPLLSPDFSRDAAFHLAVGYPF